jgi:hypothetical protein
LRVLAVLEVSSSVEHPKGETVGFWAGNDLLDLVDLVIGKLSSSASSHSVPQGRLDSGLSAKGDGESSSNSLDGVDGVRHESLSVNVRVEDTNNVLEVSWVLEVKALALLLLLFLPYSLTLGDLY